MNPSIKSVGINAQIFSDLRRYFKKGRGVLCAGNRVKYAWVAQHSADFSVHLMCQSLNIFLH
jgi:hypothetical protein